jgi:hypothetical protein
MCHLKLIVNKCVGFSLANLPFVLEVLAMSPVMGEENVLLFLPSGEGGREQKGVEPDQELSCVFCLFWFLVVR